MEKQKKSYVWHIMDTPILVDQPIYLWNGKETQIACRPSSANMMIVTEWSYKEIFHYKADAYINYRWAYVNQDLELRPTPEPEIKITDFSTIPITELKLSKRLFHLLKVQDVDSIQDIIKLKKQGIMQLRNIGTLSFVELNDSLKGYGIDLNNLI